MRLYSCWKNFALVSSVGVGSVIITIITTTNFASVIASFGGLHGVCFVLETRAAGPQISYLLGYLDQVCAA